MSKYVFLGLIGLLLIGLSLWVSDRLHYKQALKEKSENIQLLQEKLSKCQSNNIVFDGKVKKSDLNVRQFLSPLRPDTCQADTASIVTWWDKLKPRERRKYRKESQ